MKYPDRIRITADSADPYKIEILDLDTGKTIESAGLYLKKIEIQISPRGFQAMLRYYHRDSNGCSIEDDVSYGPGQIELGDWDELQQRKSRRAQAHRTGGVIPNKSNTPKSDPSDLLIIDDPKPKHCPECGGKGYVDLATSRQPCESCAKRADKAKKFFESGGPVATQSRLHGEDPAGEITVTVASPEEVKKKLNENPGIVADVMRRNKDQIRRILDKPFGVEIPMEITFKDDALIEQLKSMHPYKVGDWIDITELFGFDPSGGGGTYRVESIVGDEINLEPVVEEHPRCRCTPTLESLKDCEGVQSAPIDNTFETQYQQDRFFNSEDYAAMFMTAKLRYHHLLDKVIDEELETAVEYWMNEIMACRDLKAVHELTDHIAEDIRDGVDPDFIRKDPLPTEDLVKVAAKLTPQNMGGYCKLCARPIPWKDQICDPCIEDRKRQVLKVANDQIRQKMIAKNDTVGITFDPDGMVIRAIVKERADYSLYAQILEEEKEEVSLAYAKEESYGVTPTAEPEVEEETCDECFGSGYQNGFGMPCSKGCKPKN